MKRVLVVTAKDLWGIKIKVRIEASRAPLPKGKEIIDNKHCVEGAVDGLAKAIVDRLSFPSQALPSAKAQDIRVQRGGRR